MKTTVRSAPAMEAWHPDWWREPARAESSAGWTGWFACPVCGERLALPEAASEVFCACPACGSGVVAPQPEFGCRAMPYRDWLRLQEIDWEAATAISEASTGEAPWTGWNPGDPEETDPRHPGDPPWVARPRQWAAGLAVAALAAVAAVGVLAAGWGGRTPPHGDRPFIAATEPPPLPPAPEIPEAPEPPATGIPPAPDPPLAALRGAESGVHGPLVVRATRTHDFARAAPPEEAFVCLKLVDDADPAVSLRAYVPLAGETGTGVEALVPWGHERRVRLRIRWQPPDPAHSIAGHWLVDSLADGE